MKRAKHKKKIDRTEKFQKLKGKAEIESESIFQQDDEAPEAELNAVKIPKIVYRVSAILVVVIIALVFWMNMDKITSGNFGSWLKVKLMGTGIGDGYPMEIMGTSVETGNFLSYDGNAVVLSDTALSMYSSSGKSVFDGVRHSFNSPVMKSAGSCFLLYNQSGKDYLLQNGSDTVLTGRTDYDITTGAAAQNGEFALALQNDEYASELNVYNKSGKLKYTYSFSSEYITAVSLNSDCTMGAVCTINSIKGVVTSRITVLDFSSEEPLAQYSSQNNMLIDIFWSTNNRIYAVGDAGLVYAATSDYSFSEYSYSDKYITAYNFLGTRAAISISSYEYAGACEILVFESGIEPVSMTTENRAVSLSLYGSVVAALCSNEVLFYDNALGTELSRADAGRDSRAVALSNESSAYVLGIGEINMVSAD